MSRCLVSRVLLGVERPAPIAASSTTTTAGRVVSGIEVSVLELATPTAATPAASPGCQPSLVVDGC